MSTDPVITPQVIPAAPGYFLKWGPGPTGETARIVAWVWDGIDLAPLIDHGPGYFPGPVDRADFRIDGAKIVYRVPVNPWGGA